MDLSYYTVEQISELLHIHPKTIQRYIREGKLPASKIGKGWRVTGHDLSRFAEDAKCSEAKKAAGPGAPPEDRVKVSSVADITVDDREEAMRIVNLLTAALNCKPPEYGQSAMQAQYLEADGKVRVTLWGTLRFAAEMMGFLSALTEEEGKTE